MNEHEAPEATVWRKRFRKQESIVSREIAGETILVPIRGELVDLQRVFTLNPVAAHIWQRLDGETCLAAVRDDILDTFDVAGGRAEADIQEFVAELVEAKLIEEAP